MSGKLMLLFSCLLVLANVTQAADPSLIGWWPLDEESGETAFDASGNGNDGTLVGDALEWAPGGGRWGGALSYGGVQNDYVEFSSAGMSVSAGTVATWSYLAPDQTSDRPKYFFGHTTIPAWNNRIQLYMDGGDTDLDLGLGDSHARATSLATLATERWYHVALTWNSGQYAVYLDGEVIGSGTYTGLTTLTDIADIGNDGNPGDRAEAFKGLLDEFRVYSRALTQAEIQVIMRTAAAFGVASDPVPANEAVDVPRDVTLSWTPGEFAVTHDVYFGTTFDDVNAVDRANPMDALVSQGQNAATYQPAGILEFGQTYYWRIDEVNGAPDNTIFKGDVWSFTAEPLAYAIENVSVTSNAVSDEGVGPERTIDGSGLNELDQHSIENTDMWLGAGDGVDPVWLQYEFDRACKLHELWVWNYNIQFEPVLGFGLKDVTIEYSTDGIEWILLSDAQFTQATAQADYTHNTTIDLAGVMAKYVRLTVNSGWGLMGQYGLSEVRFFQIPAFAREPQPADGQTEVNPNTALAWRAGREAASHEVHLSTDEAAVVDGTALVDTVSEAGYAPGALDFGMTYYWKIDEVNEAATPNSWEGDVWSFSTQAYVVVDDFESYTDDEGSRIYETWIDGYGVAENGSQVGYLESPFAEQTIVNRGSQSMPLFYDNTGGAAISEAERDLGGANWTVNGADTLVVHFRGNPVAFLERADGSIVMGAEGADIWGASDELRYAYKPLNGNGSIVARVDSVVNTDPWAKVGVMIRFDANADAKNAMAYVTADGRVGWQYRELQTGASSSTRSDPGAITLPHWVRLSREGDTITAAHSSDGVTWEPMVEAANPSEPSSLQIPMDSTVLIGLALTSHSPGNPTSAEFSGVATEGNVTGSWQVEAIGVEQPSNDPGQLYVALEDTAGRIAVVNHPDENAVGAATWQPWPIPLSAFTGVNTASVRTMFIGVGDRSGAASAGSGLIFIDDIGFGHPAVAQ